MLTFVLFNTRLLAVSVGHVSVLNYHCWCVYFHQLLINLSLKNFKFPVMNYCKRQVAFLFDKLLLEAFIL